MVDQVQRRVRDRPVRAELEEIVELLNREHGPTITEIRRRLNELIDGLNPEGFVLTAGPVVGYLNVKIGVDEFAIPLHERAP